MDPERVAEILSTATADLPEEYVAQLRKFATETICEGKEEMEPLKIQMTEQEAKALCAAAKRIKLKGRISFGDLDSEGQPIDGTTVEVQIFPKGTKEIPDIKEKEVPQRKPRQEDNDALRQPRRPPEPRQLEPGDWACQCGFVNMARYDNKMCHRCGTPKDEAWSYEAGVRHAQRPGTGGGGQSPQRVTRTAEPEAQGGAANASTSEWKEAKDPSTGMTYYYHTRTRETTWTRPADMGPAAPSAVPVHGQPVPRARVVPAATASPAVPQQQQQQQQQQPQQVQQPAQQAAFAAQYAANPQAVLWWQQQQQQAGYQQAAGAQAPYMGAYMGAAPMQYPQYGGWGGQQQ
eukprot:Hpha_TRINITY_DN16796_c5_g3::TRINITY_DN16796_c5_g3_i2::g.79994::m.79994